MFSGTNPDGTLPIEVPAVTFPFRLELKKRIVMNESFNVGINLKISIIMFR